MEYQLKRLARSRSVRIRLDGNNQVVVTAPIHAPLGSIEAFVEQSSPWIERQRQRLSLRQLANPTVNWQEQVVSYLGKLYRFVFDPNGTQKIIVTPNQIYVTPVTLSKEDLPKTLLTWLRNEAERTIRERTKIWVEQMNTSYTSIGFGQQTSRWGSCTGDNRLQFNWRLIHFPLLVIDYVVIHELAHTLHHNHSDQFWRVVAQHCPDFRTHKQFLKRQVIRLE